MTRSEEQNKRIQENIKSAWENCDLLGLIHAGLDSFMNLLFSGAPIPFQRFLEDTSGFLDQYIQETSNQEDLSYVGGKLTLELDKTELSKVIIIHLSAEFYFQTKDKRWIFKKKTGKIDGNYFSDWDTNAEIRKLRSTGKLELSIEPPKTGEKQPC